MKPVNTNKYQFVCPYCNRSLEFKEWPPDLFAKENLNGRVLFCPNCRKKMSLKLDEKTDNLAAIKFIEKPLERKTVQEEIHKPSALELLQKIDDQTLEDTGILRELAYRDKPLKPDSPFCSHVKKELWMGYCICDNLVTNEQSFCPHCGQRLEWSFKQWEVIEV